MADKVEQLEFQSEEQLAQAGPVTCLGMTFENDAVRRAYFTEELRKKLPELRNIEGFPIGEDEDILALSDPPYYTACPNPWISDFISEWESHKTNNSVDSQYHREPFATDVSEGKNDPIYSAHSYHTKVPHKAIMRYILHYTDPGDIVFDGFAGTGMTGVAAQMCGDRNAVIELGYQVLPDGTILQQETDDEENTIWTPFSKLGARRAVLNDLSPAATFIAYNYNFPVEVNSFERELKRILSEVEKECSWMFETQHSDGRLGRINYTVWSDVFICPECTEEVVFWEAAVDNEAGSVKDEFPCPNCKVVLTKRRMERAWTSKYDSVLKDTTRQAKQVPVLINYTVGGKRAEKTPDGFDLALINKIEDINIPYDFPFNELVDGYNTRQPKGSHGITHVHHFYTKRNLYVLAIIAAKGRGLLSIAQLSMWWTNTKMYRYRWAGGFAGAGGGPLAGTLYVPSLFKDISILESASDNFTKTVRKKNLLTNMKPQVISCSSSENILLKDSVFDYLFFDPPFGANLNYSELSFIWEAWLKVLTNNSSEAIENTVQGKGANEYRHLITSCFKEAFRLLKPGRWMTVEFSNTKASVWNSIQTALTEAGFIIANVSALNKKQGSFKAVTTTVAVKQDLVISAYKPSDTMKSDILNTQDTQESTWNFIKNHLEQLPVFSGKRGSADLVVERTPRVLFDRMISYYVQSGLNVPISSAEFQEGVAQRYPMRDGMVFLPTQVVEYDKKRILAKEFIQLSFFVSDENSAIEWLRQQLLKKPQTRQDLHPNFMKEIQHIAKHEMLPELDVLLEQNFLKYEGDGEVPSQIHTYLSTDYKDLRNLSKNDPKLIEKAQDRWYVPDPNKQADLEKLREKLLLREFNQYVEDLSNNKKKLKQFRTEAIRVGFYKAWSEKDYNTIVSIGNRLPETILQEDDKLLRYFDNAQTKLGL